MWSSRSWALGGQHSPQKLSSLQSCQREAEWAARVGQAHGKVDNLESRIRPVQAILRGGGRENVAKLRGAGQRRQRGRGPKGVCRCGARSSAERREQRGTGCYGGVEVDEDIACRGVHAHC